MVGLLWILIGIIALLVVMIIYYFNRFAVLQNRIENSLAQIKDALLCRDENEAQRVLNIWDYENLGRRVGRGSNTPPDELG